MMRILQKKKSRRTVLALVVIYAIFSFALLPLGFVKNEFFPKEDAAEFFVSLELPAGSKLDQTIPFAQPMMQKLIQYPSVEFVTAEVGRSSGSNSVSSSLGDAANSIFFSVRLVDKEARKWSSQEIAEMIRSDYKNFEGGKVSVVEESGGGPPAGADLQIKVAGNDLNQLNAYADQLVEYLKAQPGVNNVEKSVKDSTSKIRFVPDYAKLAEHGVTVDSIGGTMRLYASGFTLDQINFDETTTDKTDITFRMQDGYSSLTGLSQLQVTTSRGQSIPLTALGEFKLETNPTSIVRDDFKRTISVTGAVSQGYSISEINKKLEEHADSLNLAKGYSWKTGGVNEENAKSVQSILQAMVISAILILVTMVIQFQSFRQALIVLIVIHLAVSSVFLAFALTGVPLSFPALIGVLSLFGIVVTNSMFIVDKINLNLREKMEFKEAIADAGASRLEPIILTKLSTVLGLLPITLSEPLWRGLGGAIISGLLVASTIMLLFIPTLYFEWMGSDKQKATN
jgi:HAE1 family hydrophobic/amphiphilic exporter-1